MIHSMAMSRLGRCASWLELYPPQLVDVDQIDLPKIIQILTILHHNYFCKLYTPPKTYISVLSISAACANLGAGYSPYS